MKDRVTGETVKPFPTPPSVTLVDCAVSFMVLAHAEEVKKRLGSECKMIMIAPLSGAFNIW